MENALVNLLNCLSKEYEVNLVLEEKKGELLSLLDKNINIKEYTLSNNKNIIIRKLKNFVKRNVWILKNKNKYDFSCNYATYSLIGSRLALHASKNNLLYVHSDYYSYYNGNVTLIKKFFNDIRLEKFKNIAFVSNESKNNILKIYPNKSSNFVVINNIFDYKRFNKKNDNKIVIKNKQKTFLFLGRLEEESKRIKRLLEAMLICKEQKKDYKLLIVGNGKDKNDYKNFVKNNELENYVDFFEGTLDIQEYYDRCDVLILTSEYEGFPVVYLEALYFNKNILTTVKTSDDIIDISRYATIVNKNSKDIAIGMSKVSTRHRNKTIDFDKYNQYILNKIKKIIDAPKN